jgi:hypothetical protein
MIEQYIQFLECQPYFQAGRKLENECIALFGKYTGIGLRRKVDRSPGASIREKARQTLIRKFQGNISVDVHMNSAAVRKAD